jgi:hypothetical protein
MRMLLNIVKGCTFFKYIRSVNGVVHTSYKAACEAPGFLDVLRNGTRMMIIKLGRRLIEAKITRGTHVEKRSIFQL